MMRKEEWLPIAEYEGLYEVSSQGSVRSLDREILTRWGGTIVKPGRTLKPTVTKDGHLRVHLSKGGRQKVFFVHRLVALAFLPNPGGLPLVRHWDDVPANNNVDNLRWGTVSDNWNDMVRNGNHRNARKTHCPAGHEYTDENTYRDKRNRRTCKKCGALHRERMLEELKSNPDHRLHGTKAGDSYGCSCIKCREEKKRYLERRTTSGDHTYD